MLGWPSEPITTETDASDGAPRDPRSTYAPSRILALTLGSSVAPKTKNWAMPPPEAPSCSPAVVAGVVICCKMLARRSCDDGGAGGSRGVGSTGGAAGGSDPGSRPANIDGSAVTSASNADVDAVAASGHADALRSWACSSAICRRRLSSADALDESSSDAMGSAGASANRAGARTLRAERRTTAGRAPSWP